MIFSEKQQIPLQWWQNGNENRGYDGIICDGAVRSGKTLAVGLGFFCWAMCSHRGKQFGVCGKTIVSVRRNLVMTVLPMLEKMGFDCKERVSQNMIEVRLGERVNTFYLFGGKDEGAAALIQGITLAGILLDEVALMPRSFVEQALARCSVKGARMWFSCNPESPMHWFYQEWILPNKEKNVLYVGFTMEDNPSLSEKVKKRYETMFQGAFFRRFVLGEWVSAEGLVYDFFSRDMMVETPVGDCEKYYVSCDYGTVNPTSMGLWGRLDGIWYRIREYYYDSRKERRQKIDSEYGDDLDRLVAGLSLEAVVVDPSAASFITLLKRRGYPVVKAKNQVVSGIRHTAELLKSGKIVICQGCEESLREFSLYRWDGKAEEDRVVKEHDHAMDEIRYFATTVLGEKEAKRAPQYYAGMVQRRI